LLKFAIIHCSEAHYLR